MEGSRNDQFLRGSPRLPWPVEGAVSSKTERTLSVERTSLHLELQLPVDIP